MYRALAVLAQQSGVSTNDAPALASLAQTADIRFDGENMRSVFINGQEVSGEIRSLVIGQSASEISVLPEVRHELVRMQKSIIRDGGFVLEGRDTTTVVAPDADLKIFLTASIEERARRRWLEAQTDQAPSSLQDVVVDVVQRDHRDYSRADSPLCLGEDAVIIETFGLIPPEVCNQIVRLLIGDDQ
jgi:cytidylate kinase